MKAGGAVGGLVGVLALGMWAGGGWARAPSPIETPPATPAAPTPEPSDSVKLAQDPTSRLTLEVTINGRGPFAFLVDTGLDRTVISRELAASLALPEGARVRMQQSTGVDEVGTVVIDRLAVGSRVIDRIEAPALAAENLGAAGILGVDALRDLHVVMDFETMRMSSSPSREEAWDGHTIVVHGRGRFGQLVLVNARIRGERIYVVLDSGSQLSVGNPALLRLLTGRGVGGAARATTQIVSVTGRTVTVELDDIPEADVGGLVIRHMPLAFAPLPIFGRFGLTRQPALLLGMDVLSLCRRVSVDLRRREATFTLN